MTAHALLHGHMCCCMGRTRTCMGPSAPLSGCAAAQSAGPAATLGLDAPPSGDLCGSARHPFAPRNPMRDAADGRRAVAKEVWGCASTAGPQPAPPRGRAAPHGLHGARALHWGEARCGRAQGVHVTIPPIPTPIPPPPPFGAAVPASARGPWLRKPARCSSCPTRAATRGERRQRTPRMRNSSTCRRGCAAPAHRTRGCAAHMRPAAVGCACGPAPRQLPTPVAPLTGRPQVCAQRARTGRRCRFLRRYAPHGAWQRSKAQHRPRGEGVRQLCTRVPRRHSAGLQCASNAWRSHAPHAARPRRQARPWSYQLGCAPARCAALTPSHAPLTTTRRATGAAGFVQCGHSPASNLLRAGGHNHS